MDINEAIALSDRLIEDAASTLITPFRTPQFTGVATTKEARTELERAKRTREETQNIIDIEQVKISEATTKGKEALDAEAVAKADLARAESDRAQQVADIHKYFNQLFGIDNDPSADIAVLSKQVRQDRAVSRAMLDTIQEMQSVGIADNPLEWLFNQIQLPSKIATQNRQADKVDAIQGGINMGIKSAQDSAAQNEKGIPTTTAAKAKAIADAALAEAIRGKAAADLALSKTNIDFATKKLSEDLAIANATKDTTALELQNAMAVYQAKINEIQFTEKRAERQMKAAELLDKLGQSQALDVLLRNYDNIIGNPQGTTNRQLFNKLPSAMRENIAAVGAGRMGIDPYDALKTMRDLRIGPDMSKETQTVILWLNQQTAAISKQIETSSPGITKEQKEIKLGERLREIVEEQRGIAYQPGTLFHEVEPVKLLAAGVIDPISITGKSLKTLTDQSGPMKPEIIVANLLEAWGGNSTIAGQAVAEYYKKNIKFMNSAMNLQLMGIKPQTSYDVPLQIGPFVSKTFDLTKPEEATKYILFKQFKDRMGSTVSALGGATVAATGPLGAIATRKSAEELVPGAK